MIQFDNGNGGKNRRQEIHISHFPGATAIAMLEQEFHQGKYNLTPEIAINSPIKLYWVVTMHKIQGTTLKNLKCIILYLDCWLRSAMIYVAPSRIQTITQHFSQKGVQQISLKVTIMNCR